MYLCFERTVYANWKLLHPWLTVFLMPVFIFYNIVVVFPTFLTRTSILLLLFSLRWPVVHQLECFWQICGVHHQTLEIFLAMIMGPLQVWLKACTELLRQNRHKHMVLSYPTFIFYDLSKSMSTMYWILRDPQSLNPRLFVLVCHVGLQLVLIDVVQRSNCLEILQIINCHGEALPQLFVA